jgi:hypothetical protein
MSAELKGLNSDVAELKFLKLEFLKSAERQSVKEVILTEVSTISVKIKSFYGTIREKILNETKWSAVVAGKQIIRLWKTG